jgi:multidrug efflux pump subunit AcrA (membrane-fusion protein)
VTPSEQLFRREALDHHSGGAGALADVLHSPRAWLNWSYRLLVLVAAAGLAFACFARVDEYATGAAVIRAEGPILVTAQTEATVGRIDVAPGERVVEGQVVMELNGPGPVAGLIRAPCAGIVAHIRVRPGQPVRPGDDVLVLAQQARFRLVMAFPGQYQRALHAGLTARVELSGYRYAYQSLEISWVGNQLVEQQEASRFMGADETETTPLTGPLVVAAAPLPFSTFSVDGRSYDDYDGMRGIVRVQTRRTSILMTLFPWLRTLLERGA